MAVEDIIKKIEVDASAEAERIAAEAQQKAEQIRAAGKEAFSVLKKEKTEAMKHEEERIKQFARVTSNMAVKMHHLNERRAMISKVIERAKEQVAHLSDDDYKSFLVKRLQELPGNEGVVIPAHGKSAVTKAAVKEAGKGYAVGEEEASLKGGFRFEQGDLAVDASTSRLLNDIVESHESEIAEKLFGSKE